VNPWSLITGDTNFWPGSESDDNFATHARGVFDLYSSPSIVPAKDIANYSALSSMTHSLYYGGAWGTAGDVVLQPGGTLSFQGQTNQIKSYYYGPSEAPTMEIGGAYAVVKMWGVDGGIGAGKQYVNLMPLNGFTTTVDTDTENNVTGNGVEIQLGGAGAELATQNICFQVYNLGEAPPPTTVPEPSSFFLLVIALLAICQVRVLRRMAGRIGEGPRLWREPAAGIRLAE
jgi:hypothetical protein